MRARQLRRAAPVALLASMTLISTPGVTFADPAPNAQEANPRLAAVAQQQEQDEGKSLDEQIKTAEKALEKAKQPTADTQKKLDNTTAQHEKAKQATIEARDQLEQSHKRLKNAETELRQAEQRVDKHSAAGFSFDGMVNSVLSFLGSDVTDSLSDKVGDRRDAVKQAEGDVSDAEREETKAQQARKNAQQAHDQSTAKQDEKQADLDKLNEQKAAEQEQAGGGAAPAAAPGIVKPAEGTFTSGYGARWGTTHYGVDIANETGTPINSAMAGTVISSGPASGFGLWVRVQHDNGLITVYGHINESLVSVGQRVEAGQQIATIGSRGQSTGPHLHFEIIENGTKIDPLPWLEAHGIML